MYLHRYKEGMLQAKTADPETVALVQGATSGMVNTIEQDGVDAVAEWEVRLLETKQYFLELNVAVNIVIFAGIKCS